MISETHPFSWQKLPHQLMLDLASRAKSLRKTQGFSQAELAERSGVSLGSLKRFEHSGQISLDSLLKLAFTLKALDEFELLFPAKENPSSLDDLLK